MYFYNNMSEITYQVPGETMKMKQNTSKADC